MEFKPYEAKPVTRMAFQINDGHVVEYIKEATYSIIEPLNPFETRYEFKAYQYPLVGDWVVRLTEEDTYHCTDTVFRERNIVPD